ACTKLFLLQQSAYKLKMSLGLIYNPSAVQINRAGTMTVGKIEKERLTEQWRHIWCFSY
ncbi:hypothetical protein MKW98_008567, partial [Papaver atlanticum]